MSSARDLAGAVDDVEQQERGEEAVAGGGAAGEDDVAGLFAAEGGAGGEHLLEDVLVADGGAEHLDAAALEGGFEAHVGHGGGDDGGVGEEAEGLEVAGGEQEDGVAVDDVAVLVGEEGAVGVAVEGDAHGGFLRDDFGGDDVGVERAAVLVDVAAVGAGVGEDDFAAAVWLSSAKSCGAMAEAAPLAQSTTMRRPSRERSGTAARRKRMYSARSASLTGGGELPVAGCRLPSWQHRGGGRFRLRWRVRWSRGA